MSSSSGSTSLVFKDVVFSRPGGFRVNANTTFSPGKLTVILGPSGSGKTTLLDLAAGFLTPDSGDIFEVKNGSRLKVNNIAPEKRRTGVVFQDFALFPHMSVLQNVSFGPRMRGAKRSEAVEKALSGLEMTGMQKFAGRKPAELSGGEKQRAALARAMAIEPDILLLDEPFSALDAALRRSLRMEVKRLQQKTGITTVLVTHDQDEALALADILIVMKNGRIVQEGTPFELWHNPKDAFTASFLGRSIKLKVFDIQTLSSNRYLAVTGAGDIILHSHNLPQDFLEPPSVPALLAIRPEEVEIHPAGELAGIVNSSEYTGTMQRVKLTPANGREESGTMEINWPAKEPPEEGSEIRMRLKENGRASLLSQNNSGS